MTWSTALAQLGFTRSGDWRDEPLGEWIRVEQETYETGQGVMSEYTGAIAERLLPGTDKYVPTSENHAEQVRFIRIYSTDQGLRYFEGTVALIPDPDAIAYLLSDIRQFVMAERERFRLQPIS